ncbi:MAG: N-acetylmuramoyl-L-alanine amidase, partial [Paracoccaceae bacterium]
AGLDLTGTDDVVANVLMDLARLDTAPRSDKLAAALVAGIENAVGTVNSRPLRSAGFSVLKAADIPSVLVEAGFLSTPEDRRNLVDPDWRAGLAAGIRDGVQAWAVSDAADAPLRRK